MSVNSDRNPKCSCQPKVCNLDGAILVDQQVSWLQVSVQDSSGVAENNALEIKCCWTLYDATPNRSRLQT